MLFADILPKSFFTSEGHVKIREEIKEEGSLIATNDVVGIEAVFKLRIIHYPFLNLGYIRFLKFSINFLKNNRVAFIKYIHSTS